MATDEPQPERPARIGIPTWAVYKHNLDPGALRTYCALLIYETQGRIPSIVDMADDLGIHRTTVQRQLDELGQHGLVHRRYWRGPDGRHAVAYTLAGDEPLVEQSERLSKAS